MSSQTPPVLLAASVLVLEIPGLMAYLGAAMYFLVLLDLQTDWGALLASILTSLLLTILLCPVLLTTLFFLLRSTITHLRLLRLQLAGLLLCLSAELIICVFMLVWKDPNDKKDMLIPSLVLGLLHGFPYLIGSITCWIAWINNRTAPVTSTGSRREDEQRASTFTSLLHGEVVRMEEDEDRMLVDENELNAERRPLLSNEV